MIGPQAVPALIEALKDENEYIRGNAAAALGNMVPGAAKDAIPALREASTTGTGWPKQYASGALLNIEGKSRQPIAGR